VRLHAHIYRWRRWLIAAGVLLILRVLLPVVLQHVIASQASKILRARVVVGDVDLSLHRGGVALKDVAVLPANAGPDAPPLIAWKLFGVELRWLPLFHKTIQLREVVIDSPHVSLERMQNGGLNLTALVPVSETPAPAAQQVPSPTPAEVPAKSGWGFGVDRFVLRTGNVRFQDLMMAQSKPLEIRLPAIEVGDLGVRPGMYGQPAQAHIEMKLDEGVLKIDSSVMMRADGIAAETVIAGERLPLRRSRLYIPKVGWSDLGGTVSLDVTHHIDTNGSRHDIRGSIGIQDVLVRVPGFEDNALAWRALNVQVEQADLIGRRIAVAKVDWDGLTLPIRSGGKEPFPVLKAIIGGATSGAPPTAPSPVPSPAAAPPAAQPWHWSLGAAQLTDAKLLVLHDATRLDLAVAAEVHDLAGEGAQPATVKLGVGIGEGSVNVDGKLRVVPIGFGGHIVVDKLDLPRIVSVSGAVAPEILPAAHLGLDLHLDAASLAPTPGDVNVAGTIALSDVQVAPPEPKGVGLGVRALSVTLDQLQLAGMLATEGVKNQGDLHLRGKLHVADPSVSVAGMKAPAASVRTIDLTLDEISAPALLARRGNDGAGVADPDIRVRGKLNLVEPRAAAANAKEFSVAAKSVDVGFEELLIPNPQRPKPGPMRVRLRDVSIASPDVQVTRTKEGIVLPEFTGAPAGSRQAPEAAAKKPSPATTAAPGETPSFDVSLAAFRLTRGRIAFTDRAVKPYYSGLISPLDIEVRQARFPPMSASRVRLNAAVAPGGTITVAGAINPSGGTIESKVDGLDLTPFNPYATTYSPYGIGQGSLTVTTKADFSSDGYKTDNSIVLHDLDVTGAEGDTLFEQNFGIPLTVALALLKDMSGNITLDVPVSADKNGMKTGIATIVAGALRSALMGTLTSPLKLVGMAFGGGKAQASAPPQVTFRAGRPELTKESEQHVKQLATFVASRPGIGVTLVPVPSTQDVRWLREQALAAELGKPQGIWGALKNLGKGGQRDRIAKALAARANDEPGELDADDSKVLQEWLDRRPAPTAEQLQALTAARLAKIEHVLEADYGVEASRITRGEASAEATDAAPVVRLQIGPVQKG
jgi:hypothetical protein